MKLFKQQSGFTLVEILITLAVFVTLSTVISSIFLNVNKLQQRTAVLQRVQNEGRYMIEKIAREIRAREVEYPLEADNPQDLLNFRPDEQGQVLNIKYVDSDGDGGKDSISYIIDDEAAQLNATDVEVTKLLFFVSPILEDVWSQAPASNLQPRVTILLGLKSKNRLMPIETTVQTTISSKVYRR